jgi:hypothetical protein
MNHGKIFEENVRSVGTSTIHKQNSNYRVWDYGEMTADL